MVKPCPSIFSCIVLLACWSIYQWKRKEKKNYTQGNWKFDLDPKLLKHDYQINYKTTYHSQSHHNHSIQKINEYRYGALAYMCLATKAYFIGFLIHLKLITFKFVNKWNMSWHFLLVKSTLAISIVLVDLIMCSVLKVLLLDEPTSALDQLSEVVVQ